MALGKNATLKRTGQSVMAAVTNLDWAGRNWAVEETTPHDANKYTTRNLTLATDGPITLVLNPFNPANADHAALRAANQAGSDVEITLTEPNGDAYAGTCGVQVFKPVTGLGNHAYQVTLTPLDEMELTEAE